MSVRKLFVINPGSTSTKIALFHEHEMVFSTTVEHSAEDLAAFKEISDQLEYREKVILEELEKAGVSLEGCVAFVGRGGSTYGVVGGTYEANPILIEHLLVGITGHHPSSLAVPLADRFAIQYGGRVFMISECTDELQDLARVTGVKGVYRDFFTHTLNQKEVAHRYAASIGKEYKDLNLVISHMGGGVSVSAHRKGRTIDTTDVIHGDGPMAPTRSGALPAVSLVKLCFSGKYTQREVYNLISKEGGMVSHLGVADVREVSRRAENGDEYAKLIYDAMIYQIGKYIGAYAAVLKGEVDAVLLTGGISKDPNVVKGIEDMVKFIAPVVVYPGEFEMEGLAAGAIRVLDGVEEPLIYNGKPVWEGFPFVTD